MKKTIALLLSAVMLLSICAGCTSGEPADPEQLTELAENSAEASYPMTIENYGRTITINEKPKAVVTASPNCTEMLITLGLEDLIIGRAGDAGGGAPLNKYKDIYEGIPVLGEMSATVESIVNSGCDFVVVYEHMLSHDLSVEGIEEYGINVYVTHDTSVEDFNTECREIGQIFGVEGRAEKYISEQQQRIEAVQAAI